MNVESLKLSVQKKVETYNPSYILVSVYLRLFCNKQIGSFRMVRKLTH